MSDKRAQQPPLVARAIELAERAGFEHSSTPEVGGLLHVLARQIPEGVIGEIGTGYGVGSAWIACALAPEVSLVTVELDKECAAQASRLFEPFPSVRVLQGDWHDILAHGPFALLFADGGKAKQDEPEAILQAVRPGGLIVLDDLTPQNQWPPEWRGQPDPVREFWLKDPRVAATEVLVTPSMAVILAARAR
jgi:predicted O-methyltransferase YrrM